MQLLGFPPGPTESETLGGGSRQSVLYQGLRVILIQAPVWEALDWGDMQPRFLVGILGVEA